MRSAQRETFILALIPWVLICLVILTCLEFDFRQLDTPAALFVGIDILRREMRDRRNDKINVL